jgi:hypothetical protein
MARAEVPPSLEAIRNHPSSSLREKIAALKQLKHDIIGHDQRKELVICHGVVAPLVRNLQGLGGRGKRRSGRIGQDEQDEDEVRVQSIQIITSLAHGTCNHQCEGNDGARGQRIRVARNARWKYLEQIIMREESSESI